MNIDQEDFERRAQHVLDTVVKPQVERYEQAKAIEEAATNYLHRVADGKRCTGYADEDFIEGAKWQAERMYSEEELRDAMNWMLTQYFEFHEQPTTGRIDYYIQSLKQQKP